MRAFCRYAGTDCCVASVECPKKDIITATGGEEICCKDDTCLVDVPPSWGGGDIDYYYPQDYSYAEGASLTGRPPKKATLAPGTCTYPDKKKWLCKRVRFLPATLTRAPSCT